MRSNLVLLPALVLTACGIDTSPISAPPTPMPRLERVGTAGVAAFNAAGFPARIAAPAGVYTLDWEGGVLRHVTAEAVDHRIEAAFTYSGEQLVEVAASCTGACTAGATRHDHLAYTAAGGLATWETHAETPVLRTYAYDELDRLVAIGGTRFTYNEDGCPRLAQTGEAVLEYVYSDQGRLAAVADDRGVVGIDYNTTGLVAKFEASAQVLDYAAGDARGLDLWPGHLFGGAARGYPEHGELFHLDGACDPTLSSQQTILSLVLGSLL